MRYQFEEYKEEEIIKNHLHLGGKNPAGERIDVNSRYLERGGKPWIPIVGEFHFSRYDNQMWEMELAKMKAGGINIVSTYLFWIYHEEEENDFQFDRDRDVRKFVLLAQKVGLDVILRIGGWVHGECRNGGFPDWLLKKSFKLRDNNEGYLAQIRKWYGKIYEQVEGLFYKDGGNIVGIQLENELVDNAEHLAKLKEIALEIGLEVPIYTVTGWNSAYGARIPEKEVLPVFGGYCEAPWAGHTERLQPSKNFFFVKQRNDSAIGADLIPKKLDGKKELPYHLYPFATCELGGGLQVTHHRRPLVLPMDIYALALTKLGCGNNMPGYYMYHGGTNKIGRYSTLQESKATGYSNDYPILSYDFQAPLGEYGQVREHYRLLKLLHLFLQDYSEDFAPMTACMGSEFIPINDTEKLRYAMRTNGKSGFIFVNHYQRLDELEIVERVSFDTPCGCLPEITVQGENAFFIAFGLDLQGAVLDYALAQPVCVESSTYFFMEIPGIDVIYSINGKEYRDKDFYVGDLHIVTLTMEQAKYLYRCNNRLYMGKNCDLYEWNGEIELATAGKGYYIWENNEFIEVEKEKEEKKVSVYYEKIENPDFESPHFSELHLGGSRKVEWYRLKLQGEGMLVIDKVGDVLQLYVNQNLVADIFYYGKPWEVDSKILKGDILLAVSEWRKDHYYEVEQR